MERKKIETLLSLDLDDFGISPDDLRVFLIQAPDISIFRLAYFLNKTGYWDFSNTSLHFSPANKPGLNLSVFRFVDEDEHLEWFLVGSPEPVTWVEKYPQSCFLVASGGGVSTFDNAKNNTICSLIDYSCDFIFISGVLPLTTPAGKKTEVFDQFSELYNFLSSNDLTTQEE